MNQSISFAVLALVLVSTLTAAAAAACVKIATRDLSIVQIVMFRGLFALPVLLLATRLDGPLRKSLVVQSPSRHLERALIGCAGLACYYVSIRLLPLSLAAAVAYLVPTFVTMAELLRRRGASEVALIATALIGLGGVCLILGPQVRVGAVDDAFWIGIAWAIAGAVLTSVALLRVKALARTDRPGAIALYFALACTVIGSVATIAVGWVPLDPGVTIALIGCGVFSAISHVTLTRALANADAAAVAPFDYLIIVWALLAEVLVGGRVPTTLEIAGVASVIMAMQVPRLLRHLRFNR